MKTNRFTFLLTVVFGFAAFATIMNAESTSSTDKVADDNTDSVAPPQWLSLKDITYDQRARFFAGLKRMEAVVDGQINALTAKRAAMTSAANTADWDFAMKELANARSYLKSTGEVLGKAPPETWNQEKDRVGQAWVRTQEAYAKVKSSMTN